MAITRAVPDIRSTNIEKTTRFYTQLLGFDRRCKQGDLVAFVSPTHEGVEVTLNRDGFALPPGFTVEVESTEAVSELHRRSSPAHVRVIEDLSADGTQFSVLDPAGRRVTIAARPAIDAQRDAPPDMARPITRAIPGFGMNDADAAREFYVDYLGFGVASQRAGVLIFRSPTAPGAQIIGSTDVANPDGFDLDVGNLGRVHRIYEEAVGMCVVLHAPHDFEEHGIRCFMLLDPNGIAVNVAAHIDPRFQTPDS